MPKKGEGIRNYTKRFENNSKRYKSIEEGIKENENAISVLNSEIETLDRDETIPENQKRVSILEKQIQIKQIENTLGEDESGKKELLVQRMLIQKMKEADDKEITGEEYSYARSRLELMRDMIDTMGRIESESEKIAIIEMKKSLERYKSDAGLIANDEAQRNIQKLEKQISDLNASIDIDENDLKSNKNKYYDRILAYQFKHGEITREERMGEMEKIHKEAVDKDEIKNIFEDMKNNYLPEEKNKINSKEASDVELQDLRKQLEESYNKMLEYAGLREDEKVREENERYTNLQEQINKLENDLQEAKGEDESEELSQEEEQDMENLKGIENTYIHAIKYGLDDNEIDAFVDLKEKLSKTTDEKEAFKIRSEMSEILNGKMSRLQQETTPEETKQEDKIKSALNAYAKKMGERLESQEIKTPTETKNMTEEKLENMTNEDIENLFNMFQDEQNKRNEKKAMDNYAKDGFKPPVKKDDGFYPPAPNGLPTLNMEINRQTGEVFLTEIDETNDPTKPATTYTTYMDASDYTRKDLKEWRNLIQEEKNISEEDAKYLKAIDPTIYNAYFNWDLKNKGRYNQSAAEQYVKAVIQRQKDLEKGLRGDELSEVDMPGTIEVDIGWHAGKHSKSPKGKGEYKKFGLFNFIKKARSEHILKMHGEPKRFTGKRMDLAIVKSNRWLIRLGRAGLAMLGLSATLGLGTPENTRDVNIREPAIENTFEKINDKLGQDVVNENANPEQANSDQTNESKGQTDENKQQENGRIYRGDVITVERGTALYKSADAEMPSGAYGNTKEALGVNKLSCVIDGKTYSTGQINPSTGKNYSDDEIYDIAEMVGAPVVRHTDQVVSINGKLCVRTNEVGNPSPVFIYYDNGIARKSDGTEFTGDVEYGKGYIKDTVSKADLSQVEQQMNQQDRQEGAHRTVDNEYSK